MNRSGNAPNAPRAFRANGGGVPAIRCLTALLAVSGLLLSAHAQEMLYSIQSGGASWFHDPLTGVSTYDTQHPDGGSIPFETYGGVAFGTNTLWGVLANGQVYRRSPATGPAVALWDLTDGDASPLNIYEGLAYGDGSLWALLANGSVYQVDPADGSATLLVDLPEGDESPNDLYAGIAWGNGSLWAILTNGRLYQVDPSDGTSTFVFQAPDGSPAPYRVYEGLTYAAGSLWGILADGRIHQIDPTAPDGDLRWDLPGGRDRPFGTYAGMAYLDIAAPTGSATIESGAVYALTNVVNIDVTVTDTGTGAGWVRLSNDGTTFGSWIALTNATHLTTFTNQLQWTLSPGDATKTVSVQFRDGADNISASITDTIIFEFDQDGDGMPDRWERDFFGDTTSTVAAADSDGDGMSNLEEFLAGTDPTDASSVYLGATITPATGSDLTLTWSTIVGRRYRIIEKSSPTDTGAEIHNVIGDGSVKTHTVSNAGSTKFYCLTIELF